MSNLTKLGLDKEVAEDDGSGGRQTVPSGKYRAVMVYESVNDNNAKTGKVYETRWQIIEGPHEDIILRDWWNILNPDTTCQRIGQGTLKRVCRLTGVPYPPPDATQMFGKLCILTVKIKPDWKDASKLQNEITAYNPVSSDGTKPEPPPAPEQQSQTGTTQIAQDILDEEW